MIQANSIAVVFGTIFVCILPSASCAESAHEIYARRVLPLLSPVMDNNRSAIPMDWQGSRGGDLGESPS